MTDTVLVPISQYTNITAKSSADPIPNQHEITSRAAAVVWQRPGPGETVKSGTLG